MKISELKELAEKSRKYPRGMVLRTDSGVFEYFIRADEVLDLIARVEGLSETLYHIVYSDPSWQRRDEIALEALTKFGPDKELDNG